MGDWYRFPSTTDELEPLDALDIEELNRDRVRQLLRRYGVLFRELQLRELPALRWAALFRSLRLMEFSGEVVSGHFFEDIPGLQFASPAALRALREGLHEDRIFWVNALDPASPCGLGLEALAGETPSRLPSNHLVYHGSRRVVTSRRHGGELQVEVAPEHPSLPEYFGFLKALLTRQFHPRKLIAVETINGEAASQSPYAEVLVGMFAATRDREGLKLRRRFGAAG